MNYRIFVEKRPEFQVEAKSLRNELNNNLNLKISTLRLINVYDLFGFTEDLLKKSRFQVFGDIVTDTVSDAIDLTAKKYVAVEYLPGQFDQRASTAVDCVKLIDPTAEIRIKSSKLLIFDDNISDSDIEKIKKYLINTIESREKDLTTLCDNEQADSKPVTVLNGFIQMQDNEREKFCEEMGLAMNVDDLQCVIDYFKAEGRDPIETELRILDTYWSDHCRHTTFNTILEEITIDESFIKSNLEESLELYKKMRHELNCTHKDIC
ncbi:MAG TPA: phosphoribosylformylglycinamidine synthase, partial [Paludibacteraceae bacterium]|nr:phosphoribosylformylglycinamidine synthase [Paludibacteraceae bacterium]